VEVSELRECSESNCCSANMFLDFKKLPVLPLLYVTSSNISDIAVNNDIDL
jgi:hypothetical protein